MLLKADVYLLVNLGWQ